MRPGGGRAGFVVLSVVSVLTAVSVLRDADAVAYARVAAASQGRPMS